MLQSTGVDQFGRTFETPALSRLQHGISLVNSEVSGTSLKACFLARHQGKKRVHHSQRHDFHFNFVEFLIYLIFILSARQSGMARSLLSFSLTESPRRPHNKCSSFPMYNKDGEHPQEGMSSLECE